MFRRYEIASESDLTNAATKLDAAQTVAVP